MGRFDGFPWGELVSRLLIATLALANLAMVGLGVAAWVWGF